VSAIRSVVGNDFTLVEDARSVLAAADVAVQGLNAFFAFCSALCLVLTFFAAWLGFSANVRESSHEFAVLRTMLPGAAVARCFVYEALATTLAANALGTGVGLAVAASLSLQFNAFVELPFVFGAPAALLVSFSAGVAGVAAAASWMPARALMGASIAGLLKGRAEAASLPRAAPPTPTLTARTGERTGLLTAST
jgi:ABC-type lipoprotein release transport system permease subunit